MIMRLKMAQRFEIQLKDHQKDHVERILNILERYPGYIDGSPTGSGKTYSTMFIAKKLNLPIIVICPSDVRDNWFQLSNKYAIHNIDTITFQSISSKKDHQPRRFLRRDDSGERTFTLDAEITRLIREGVFFIIDEAQKVKNDSAQSAACLEITSAIVRSASNSKFALLSGSLFDKEEHSLQILKVMGLLDRDFTFDKDLRKFFDTCSQFVDMRRYVAEYTRTQKKKATIEHFIFNIYLHEIKDFFSSSMNKPDYDQENLYKNRFYTSKPENSKRLRELVDDLEKKITGEDTEKINITYYMQKIEFEKIELFVKCALTELTRNEKSKVIICLNYIDCMQEAFVSLREFNPMLFNGEVKPDERAMIIHAFNNDPKRRLLIMNTSLSVGFNLHDEKGDEPRFMFISPGYTISNIHQAAGRINRVGMKSPTHVELIYSIDAAKELKIIDSISRKTSILNFVHQEQKLSGMIFPGDYPIYFGNTRYMSVDEMLNKI